MAGDIADALALMAQAVVKDHETGHIFLEHPWDYGAHPTLQGVNNPAAIIQTLGMALAGKYFAAYTPLTDGQFGIPRLDANGKLMVDASVSVVATGGFTQKAYFEGVVGNVATIFNVGFVAQEFLIFNDGTKTINYELGGIPVANVNTMYGGEAMVEDYASGQIQLATFGAAETSAVRIFARG